MNFTLQWRDGDRLFETQVHARDWSEAERHAANIKRNGQIVGASQTEIKIPAISLIAALWAWWKDRTTT